MEHTRAEFIKLAKILDATTEAPDAIFLILDSVESDAKVGRE